MSEPRTNQIFVTDIPSKLEEVQSLISKIDVPVRQVMIEARIVEADDKFGRALGVKLGALDLNSANPGYGVGGGNTRVSLPTGNYLGVGEQTGQAAITAGSYIPNTQFVSLPANTSAMGGAAAASFALSQAAIKPMLKQRSGRIINISSVVGQTGNAGQANYAASKAGLIGFSKALARELASRHITVNVVAPGLIETDMTKAITDKAHGDWTTQIPLGRLGTTADVAAAVCFLASDEASYITGQVLAVNGGMYM